MTWKKVDDAAVLRGLLSEQRIGRRVILLDQDKNLAADFDPFDESTWGSFAQRYEVVLLSTTPASCMVIDLTRGGPPIGAYVWLGQGGPITTSRDARVVQLGDHLEAFYRGDRAPGFTDPPQNQQDAGGPLSGAEFDLGGVRTAADPLSAEKMLELMGEHCTPAQMKSFARLVGRKNYVPVILLNQRFRGTNAVGLLTPVVRDRFGQSWMITAAGTLERVDDDDGGHT